MCQCCNKRQEVENGVCHVCLFLYSAEEMEVHRNIVESLFRDVPESVFMSVEELTDFIVRCLPYTDTYKIANEDVLNKIASYVVNKMLPPLEEITIEIVEENYEDREAA
jgi:hypothetical protein